MKITGQPSLKSLNTFGLESSAASLVEIESEEDVLALPGFDPAFDLILGGGSNVVFLSDVPGTVYLNRIQGIEVVGESDGRVYLEVGAGEIWHRLVMWSLERGLNGLENLSLIPGSTGAAPIQNIGAYGVELASVLESVTAWDWRFSCWVTLSREDCRLGYRDSIFKSGEAHRYLVTSVRLALSRRFEARTDYRGLYEEIEMTARGRKLTATDVSNAVIRLRRQKLPDPAESGNAGSFFKNPVVEPGNADELRRLHPGIPCWEQQDGRCKISAAWMIDSCGLKGLREGGASVSEKHALVIINHGSASGHDISALAVEIQKAVSESFGIRLEPEPRLIEFSNH